MWRAVRSWTAGSKRTIQAPMALDAACRVHRNHSGLCQIGTAALVVLVAAGGGCSSDEKDDPNQSGAGTGGGSEPPAAGAEPTAGAGGASTETFCPEGIDASEQSAPPWDWVGIVGTGQSLAVGTTPVTSRTQPFNNLRLDIRDVEVPPWDPSDPALAMAPLVEPLHGMHDGYPSPYPDNLWGETPHSAMGNQLTHLVRCPDPSADFISVHTEVGESGQGIEALDKPAEDDDSTGETGRAYAATLFEAEAITRLAAEDGKSYGIGAIVMTHGETDSGNSSYEDALLELWEDYNADLTEITGQSESIPMYLSQQHAYPDSLGGRPLSSLVVWELGVEHPGDFVCTGPKYQYPGHVKEDGVHLSATGYQLLGEKTAQVIYERMVLGHDWQPLQPTNVERSGRIVTVHFNVPVPPLRWDEDLDSPAIDEWANGRGFELREGNTRLAIESVQIAGDAVELTAAEELPAEDLVVGYALSGQGQQLTGASFAVRWGQLRDSDPFVGYTTGLPNPNYAVSFEMEVPAAAE